MVDKSIKFLTIAEVAELARVSKVTVYRWVHNGQLRAVRFGRSYRIPYDEVVQAMSEGIGDTPGATDAQETGSESRQDIA